MNPEHEHLTTLGWTGWIYPKGHVKILISSGWKRGKKELHHLGRMLNL